MTIEGSAEVPRARSIKEIEQTDLGYLPVGALAIQRSQVDEYINAVHELTGLDAFDLHVMNGEAITQSIIKAQGERAA